MLIDIKNVNIFCLTCDLNGNKKKHIEKEFSEYKVDFVLPILGIHKDKSGASGFVRMIEKGLMLQKYNEPFKPFMIIEDDVSIFEHKEIIDVPDNADILYVGLS